MIVKQYQEMLGAKSVIREMFAYGTARAKEIGYDNVFDYSLGNPSVPVPEAFTLAMTDMLQKTEPAKLHGYSPGLGIDNVREAVAASLRQRFEIDYTKDHIFMTSGAASSLAHAFRAVTEPGDTILTFAPYFPEYGPYVNLTGARLKVVPPDLQGFQVDFDKFNALLTKDVTAVLLNTPNNPSGMVYSEKTMRKIARMLTEKEKEFGHEIYLISDEPYREIVFDQTEVPYPAAIYDRTITCYSFSKSLSLPGERIGYVAVSPKCENARLIIDICGQISRGIGHNCPSSIIQMAVAEVLDLTADIGIYETNRNLLYEKLISLGFSCIKPQGTFYMFPKSPEKDAAAFCKKAMEYDLLLVPGDTFGCPGYFRIAYCVDTQKIIRSFTAFEQLALYYQ